MTVRGRLLRVDLTTRTSRSESIPDSVGHAFLGGRGLGIRYLCAELGPGTDPLGADNKLIFSSGVLGATSAQGFSRWIVTTRSPLTNAVGRAVGGNNFGAAIKFAGYDLLIVEGQSAAPAYLYITNEGVQVLDAADLWGLDTQAAQAEIQRRHGPRTQVACIGPAGERLVRFASIHSGRRSASRCGVGTVMGSKRLKAIAIHATGRVAPQDPVAFQSAVQKQIGILKEHPRRQSRTAHGTTTMTEVANYMGWLPVQNFRRGSLPNAERLASEEFARIKVSNFGCYSCMTRCGQVHRVTEGEYAGAESEGPEYESIWALGAGLVNTEMGAVVAADAQCDLLGLDTISTGNALGFACELFERGLLTRRDTGGLELTWGNSAAFLQMIDQIGRREGLGQLLGEGVVRAAKAIGHGAERYAMHVKGMELPAYEPRSIKGYALSYAVSNIGGSHMYGRPRQELASDAGQSAYRFVESGKGRLIAQVQMQQAADETVIVCNFGNSGLTPELLGELLVAATGRAELGDAAERQRIGERIICLERAFNVREGFGRQDDTLPERMLTEPLQAAGSSTGQVVRQLDALLDEYYAALGYTPDGIPTRERMEDLGLCSFA
ncbi:MAG: aldehyde ferredoxin oxidoreductase family protein [Chloroflexi bacterium]|nr:aldehyde ferredoxin oxidoreductase family protein [Chloroflexota bacterium]